VFLIWELLGGLILSLVQRSHDLALRKQGLIYEAAFWSLTEGVAVAGANGKLLLLNTSAERILGMGPVDLAVPQWSSTYGCFYPDGETVFPAEQLPLARAIRARKRGRRTVHPKSERSSRRLDQPQWRAAAR